ncbi:GDSL-type esterase/lipase family protein [Runella salmonicolor]|uniref:GDSL-type esterase/lipase family protein n=1 Tax=Runella salmonicolor TaxID=2950278 RepID=A0ABT1FV72_9BACT|nr:GDSL-type esterase/lipase family protein [Runella salmonicolor]MCP1385659.1 GDSL-type esterase/lipase family protein [Runella salmonicolor]
MISKLITSLIRLAVLSIPAFLLFFPDKINIKFDYPYAGLMDNFYIRLAKAMVLFFVLIELLRMFYYGIIKNPKGNKIVANIATLGIMVVWLAGILEIAFMFVSQSHEGDLSKASQIWFAKYWKPITAEGYRDFPKTGVEKKKKVLVLGDSFAAGHGLDKTEERFSDQLEQKLGADKYAVYNLGVSGSDTRDEFQRLQKFPVKPDVLVLEYFPNDIERAARDAKLTLAEFKPYDDIKLPGIGSLVMRFYLPNYIYWQFPHMPPASITDFVQKSYTDTTILNPHLRDLQKIVDYARAHKAPMYVVMVPFLQNVEKSNGYTKPIEDFFTNQQIPVVRLSEHLGPIPPKERIVGKNDGHASAKVNAVIADKLFEQMKVSIK